MQNKQFKYYLRKKISAGVYEYYYLNAGVLASQVSPIEIGHSPAGWDEQSLEWKRGLEWFGVFTNMTTPLRFNSDGAKILRSIYYTEGIEGNCELYIEKLNDSTQLYELYYRGELDFSKILDEDNYVSANVMDGSYMESLKSRESTTYELDIDGHPDFFYIRMDGITLKSRIEYITINEPAGTFPTSMFNNVWFNDAIGPTISMVREDASAVVGVPYTQSFTQTSFVSGNFYPNPDRTYFFICHNDSTYDMDIDFRVALRNQGVGPTASSQDPIKLEIRKVLLGTNATLPFSTVIYTTPTFQASNGSTTIYNINLSFTGVAISKGDRIGLVMNVITAAGIMSNAQEYDIAIEAGTIDMEFATRIPETYIKALNPEVVFDNLVDEISNNEVSKSAAPLVTNKSYAITSGDAIRGIPALLKTSFADFFNSYNPIINLGTYYDKTANTHYITDKSDLFDSGTLIYDIGEVSNLTVKPLTEEIPSGMLIGYPEIKVEGLNGNQAFNDKMELTTPVTRVKNEVDYRGGYIADPFEIELYRANLEGKTTTSGEVDNNIFLIHIESASAGTHDGVPYYDLYRDPAMVITGILFPDEMFNIELSPKRNMLRSGSYYHSLLHLMESDYIKFQSSDRNKSLSTTLGAVTITESANVLISDLDAALFLPIIFEFDCVNPVNVQSLLDANPYGYMTFDWKGNQYEGFLMESSENPARRPSQRIKLLATPNNTLSNLI